MTWMIVVVAAVVLNHDFHKKEYSRIHHKIAKFVNRQNLFFYIQLSVWYPPRAPAVNGCYDIYEICTFQF